jgi:hypothetical protein
MAAKFSPKIRTFVASSLIDNITLTQIEEWQATTGYNEGDVTFYGGNKYIARETGTSGTTAPTHVSGTANDGSIDWIFVEYININEMFKRNMFVAIGKSSDWTSEPTPDAADITDAGDYTTLQNIISLVRVSNNNFRLGIRRYDWTTGTVYDYYDLAKDPLAVVGDDLAYANPFFVYTDELNIYKCIDNNNGAASTSKPGSTSTAPFTTADGYVWKFMGALDADAVNFLSTEFVPVRYKATDDGSLQYDVQQAAIAGSMSSIQIIANSGTFPGTPVVNNEGTTTGTDAVAYAVKDGGNNLTQVLLSNYGSEYDITQDSYFTVQQQAATDPSTDAILGTVSVDGSGVITSIAITNAGAGYDDDAVGGVTTTLLLYDPAETPGTGADIDAIITSGSVSSIVITDGGSGYSADTQAWLISGTAGAVGSVVFAPKEGHGANITTELTANNAIITARLTESSDYLLVDAPDNEFRQVSLVTDVVDKTTLEPAYNLLYAGPSHPDWGGATLNEIDATQGYVLYLNNISVVTRSTGQEEDIKIVVTF